VKSHLAVVGLVAVLGAGRLAAQADDPYQPVKRDPLGTRFINGATPFTVGARKWQVEFTHRFHLPVQDGDSHDLWGLDSGADVGLGLTFGVGAHGDLSLYRSAFQEDFELAGKFLVLEQAPRIPVTLAFRAGADLLRRPGVDDPSRPFVQVLLTRRLYPGIDLLLSPSWVRDTPRLRNAWNVPIGLTFPLPGEHLLKIEVIPKNRDLDGSRTAWHASVSKTLGGHVFELVAGNSRATTVDQMLGGDSAAGFATRDIRLGFNITRSFSY
jgi:hypothetical protein